MSLCLPDNMLLPAIRYSMFHDISYYAQDIPPYTCCCSIHISKYIQRLQAAMLPLVSSFLFSPPKTQRCSCHIHITSILLWAQPMLIPTDISLYAPYYHIYLHIYMPIYMKICFIYLLHIYILYMLLYYIPHKYAAAIFIYIPATLSRGYEQFIYIYIMSPARYVATYIYCPYVLYIFHIYILTQIYIFIASRIYVYIYVMLCQDMLSPIYIHAYIYLLPIYHIHIWAIYIYIYIYIYGVPSTCSCYIYIYIYMLSYIYMLYIYRDMSRKRKKVSFLHIYYMIICYI